MIRKLITALVGIVALLALLLACQQVRNSNGPPLVPAPGGTIRVATYNVHYILMNRSESRWSAGDWERRKGPLDATVERLDADLIAFQEMESFAGGNDDSVNLARNWLLANNPGYAAAAIGDWRTFPSTQPVFYRPDRLEPLDQGWFFFSDTPDVIYSRTFDGSYPAFASWVDFRDRASGRKFRVINVHLDYSSRENRNGSIALIVDHIAAWRGEGRTVLLAGDLNARLGSSLHERVEEVGLTFVPVSGATYHFDLGLNLFAAIDHIAHSPDLRLVGAPMVFRERLGDAWPTDHYPVVADFTF